MTAYYNEIDKYCAQWLRNLIAAGMIAPGDVDERSIEDVRPDDLRGYRQAHFFGGLGAWSYALRLAGIPDDRRIWTGSCPCQPFSAAGKGAGFADERHLWPAFFHLIRECRPERVVGEQVASNLAWWDLVASDLEAEQYACGAVILPAASVGAPHIRHRLYWVADREDVRKVSRNQTTGRLREGTSSEGRAAVLVQGLSKRPTSGARLDAGREAAIDAREADGEGLRPPLSAEVRLEDVAAARAQEGGEVRLGVRPRRTRGSDANSRREDDVRDDRAASRVERRSGQSGATSLEHPLTGSDRPDEGVHVSEHQDRVLGDERGNVHVGRGSDEDRDEGVDEEWLNGPVQAEVEGSEDAGRQGDSQVDSVGAPHIRQRLYWVADADPSGRSLERRSRLLDGEWQAFGDDADGCGSSNWLGDADDEGLEGWGMPGRERAGELAPWAASVLIPCADERLRPVPPQRALQPLVDGDPAGLAYSRTETLRAAGNAIVPQVAAAFLKALP